MRTFSFLGIHAVITALAFLVLGSAHAGRPMITDDATLVEHCQLESWWQRESGDSALWVLPACTFAQVEWSLGGANNWSSESNVYAFAAKKSLVDFKTNHFGITAEVAHEITAGRSLSGDTHINLSFTKSWLDDVLLVHINAGRLFKEQHTDSWTSAIAGQLEISPSQWVFVELYREEAGRPFYQLGYMIEVLPERFQLDLSYGSRLHEKGIESYVTAGFVYYFKLY